MIWIFALGVIGFAIYHPGFRKVVLWALAACTAMFFMLLGLQLV